MKRRTTVFSVLAMLALTTTLLVGASTVTGDSTASNTAVAGAGLSASADYWRYGITEYDPQHSPSTYAGDLYSGGVRWYHNWYYNPTGGFGSFTFVPQALREGHNDGCYMTGAVADGVLYTNNINGGMYPNGTTWLIGNEVGATYNASALQNYTPDQYAVIYHSCYELLKGINPVNPSIAARNFQVATGGILPHSPGYNYTPPSGQANNGLGWLRAAQIAYKSRYGTWMPIDVYNIHLYEDPNAQGYGWIVLDVRDFRTAMATEWGDPNNGHDRQKPLIASEVGVRPDVSWPASTDHLNNVIGFLNSETSDTTGLTSDSNKLVQRWAWFSLVNPNFGGYYDYTALYSGSGVNHTSLGDAYFANAQAVPTVTPTPTNTRVVIPYETFINAGGAQYVDSSGQTWLADRAYGGSNTFGYTLAANASTYSTASAIAATVDDTLYQSERWWNASGGGYRFDVANGAYQVDLKFAEIYQTAAGKRSFDIVINGTTMRSNLDIIAAAGAPNKAFDVSYVVTVSAGRLDVTFTSRLDNPKLSAIHVLPLGGAVPATATATSAAVWTSTPTQASTGTGFEAWLNAGGAQYTDSSGQTWLADRAYGGSNTFGYTLAANASTYSTASAIAATVDDTLYQSERWWSASGGGYRFDVANGAYQVDLKFAEIYQTAAGKRSFDIVINGTTMRSSFDIVAAAGAANKAFDVSYVVTVSTGRLDVTFTSRLDNPKLSAIHVKSLGGAVPATATATSAAVWTSTPTHTGTTPAFEAWLNAGGAQYTDSNGQTWLADRAYAPANAYGYTLPANTATYATGLAIAATVDDTLYQSERYWNASGGGYRFDVANGAYQVDLKFAEIYQTAAGKRSFDIVINGTTMRSSFDIVAAAGAANKAFDVSYVVTVGTGRLDVTFTSRLDNPKLSAIHVRSLGVASALEARLNAGGPQYTDSNGQTWLADRAYTTANTYGYTLPANTATYATGLAIAATVDDILYQSERWWSASGGGYRFDVANGAYQVDLKFAEIYQTAAGKRSFDIVINGATMRSSFDIVAAAGAPNKAFDVSYVVTVSTGRLDVTFTSRLDNPKLSAIQVRSLGVASAAIAAATPATASTSTSTASPSSAPTQKATAPSTPTNVLAKPTETAVSTWTPTSTASAAANQTAKATATHTATPTTDAAATAMPTSTTAPFVARVNCGGGDFTDTQGNLWSADYGYVGGFAPAAITNDITNTPDDPLFQTDHRWSGPANPGYTFAAPNGQYEVTLRFSEPSRCSANGRVFSVSVEGTTVLPDFDIFVAAGNRCNASVDRVVTTTVNDGVLTIGFMAGVAQPKVNAIQIQQVH